MENKIITMLDGSQDQREEIMKTFFGLSSDQTFQDIAVDDEQEETE